jgi:hypothetical protein
MSLRARSLILAAAAATAIAYSQRRPAAVPAATEAPPPPPETPEEPTWTPDLRPPRPAEVIAAIERAFPGVLPPEALPVHRAVAGDFNGDRSPDLAVPARALTERLPAINADLVNWILQDPRTPLPPPVPDPQVTPVVVANGDMLLAVLHGLEGAGWRNPDARQCYLLKIAFDGPLEVQKRERLVAEAVMGKMPWLRGELIHQAGSAAFLYWDGARYAWHTTTAAALPMTSESASPARSSGGGPATPAAEP